ncbi:MAG: 1-acyl-sn-glycerol-3-phosphate acyltransferase [Alphaproteobacteria bacterium]|nr:1-acyl-sn-glycerol-3-phosphate acyltransferase [Alphaproteobacteria bacterium]
MPDGPTFQFARCSPVHRAVGTLFLWLTGWRWEGSIPDVPNAVLIAAPHTSNWDLVFAMAAGWSKGLSFAWLGKDSLFRGPFGWLYRLLGGVPVDRSAHHGLVDQAAARLTAGTGLLLMVPAEGTRGYRDQWKSGFYWIASKAQVPVILGFLDYGRKRAGFGPALVPSGDVTADMDQVRAFYAPITARYPASKSRIYLSAEAGDTGEA